MIAFKTTLFNTELNISGWQISKIIHCAKTAYTNTWKSYNRHKCQRSVQNLLFTVIELVLVTVVCFYSRKKELFFWLKKVVFIYWNFSAGRNYIQKEAPRAVGQETEGGAHYGNTGCGVFKWGVQN